MTLPYLRVVGSVGIELQRRGHEGRRVGVADY